MSTVQNTRRGHRLILASIASACLALGAASAPAAVYYDSNDDGFDTADWAGASKPPMAVVDGVLELQKGTSGFFATFFADDEGNAVYFANSDPIVSLSASFYGQDSTDTHASGDMGLQLQIGDGAGASLGNYSVRLNTSGNGTNESAEDEIRLRKGSATLASIYEKDAGLNGALNSTWNDVELRVTNQGAANLLEVLINGTVKIAFLDETLPLSLEYVGITLWGNNNNDYRVDNLVLQSAVPEPAAMAMAGLVGVGGLLRRRRR